MVDDWGLQASVLALDLFCAGTASNPNGVRIAVYLDQMMKTGRLRLNSFIAFQLYDQFKAAGRVRVPDTFQYPGITFTRNHSKWLIAIHSIGDMNRIQDSFEMANCW
jgi:hypothetical protein